MKKIGPNVPLALPMICMFELQYDTFELQRESLNNQKTHTTRKPSSRMRTTRLQTVPASVDTARCCLRGRGAVQ